MIKILANDGIHPDGKSMLEKADFQVVTEKVAQEDLPTELPNYDVIIVRSATKVRKELIDQCPNLKIIARAGVGLDNIDVAHAKSKGIQVINTPAASSQSVAELVFAHLFSIARSLYKANRAMPNSGDTAFKQLKKSYSKGFQLRGKTLGIIGFGRIGQETARIGLGLGMNVKATDPMVDETNIGINIFNNDDLQLNVKLKTYNWEEILATSDIISLHVPTLSKPLLDAVEFAKMKDGVIIINCARGGTIDENALLAALESGKVAAAGLDVFENEPTPDKRLLMHPNISLSPHIGASTVEAQSNIGTELAEKIMAYYKEVHA